MTPLSVMPQNLDVFCLVGCGMGILTACVITGWLVWVLLWCHCQVSTHPLVTIENMTHRATSIWRRSPPFLILWWRNRGWWPQPPWRWVLDRGIVWTTLWPPPSPPSCSCINIYHKCWDEYNIYDCAKPECECREYHKWWTCDRQCEWSAHLY